MTSPASSLMRAIEAEALDAGSVLGVEADAGQLDLLRDDSGQLPSNVFVLARQKAGEDGAAKRGRPPGSKNKRGDQLAKLVVQQHGDPVLAMASIYAMPLDQVAELAMVADGSRRREERWERSMARLEAVVAKRMRDAEQGNAILTDAQTERLTELLERAQNASMALKNKPGELGMKAFNLKLAAAAQVAPYVHGKKPIEVDVTRRADVILNIPGLTDAAGLSDMIGDQGLSEGALEGLTYHPFTEVDEEPAGGGA